MSTPPAVPVTVLVCALGGEGGGVLAEWLYAAAVGAGLHAQSTSIPGVAQRTGATTYYIEIQPGPAGAGAPRPVFSLNPVPGAIDLLVSSELLETVRQVGQGMASAARTRIISSTARALTVAEKMVPGDGRVDAARLAATLRRALIAGEPLLQHVEATLRPAPDRTLRVVYRRLVLPWRLPGGGQAATAHAQCDLALPLPLPVTRAA